MDNERYLYLVTREITGEITAEEKVELETLLKVSAEEQEKYKLFDKFWRQEVYSDQSTDAEEALKKVMARINDAGSTNVKHLSFNVNYLFNNDLLT